MEIKGEEVKTGKVTTNTSVLASEQGMQNRTTN